MLLMGNMIPQNVTWHSGQMVTGLMICRVGSIDRDQEVRNPCVFPAGSAEQAATNSPALDISCSLIRQIRISPFFNS